VSRDQLLGRARRAVLAVAGTAGGLGSRAKRRQADESTRNGLGPTAVLPPGVDHTREPGLPPVQPHAGPVPSLPPRIERDQPTPAVPPRIERGAATALPPRIEREHTVRPEPAEGPTPARASQPALTPQPPSPAPELPPRIEHRVEPAVDVAALEAARAVAVTGTDTPEPGYEPRHAREGAVEAGPQPEPEPDIGADAQPVPIGPVRPDPLASPVKNVLRSHQRLAYIVLAVILIGAGGYWAARVHQRIGESALEAGIARQQHAPTVKCASLQSNGAAWACGVVYQAESVCFIARVNILGSWSTALGQHRCERIPAVAALAPNPATITPTMVAGDINRQQDASDFVCGKLPSHKVRWACERPPQTGGQCLVVRVIQWTSWNVLDGGKTCAHDPDLQKALKHSSA
jgi:hypothetical protein